MGLCHWLRKKGASSSKCRWTGVTSKRKKKRSNPMIRSRPWAGLCCGKCRFGRGIDAVSTLAPCPEERKRSSHPTGEKICREHQKTRQQGNLKSNKLQNPVTYLINATFRPSLSRRGFSNTATSAVWTMMSAVISAKIALGR